MKRTAGLLAVWLAVASGVGAQELDGGLSQDPCDPRGAPIPAAPELSSAPPPLEYDPLRGLDSTFDLGIGRLRVDLEAESPADTDWPQRVEVPVYAEPGNELSGWVAEGWWVPSADPARATPLTTEAMVETGYGVASWIVEEAREDGWVRFRFAPGPDGSGWASTCHLSASDPPVAYESWEARFSGENAGPLFFRTRERHALRRGPGTEFARSFWLTGYEATELHPLEIRGDWMRVRVNSPPVYCADSPPSRGIAEEGWIRWRDEEIGPWVWWFTRGC